MNDIREPQEPSDPTGPIEQDQPGPPADEPTEQIPAPGQAAGPAPAPGEPHQSSHPAEPVAESITTPSRPTGPHAPTVLLGLACLVVAALVIADQSADVSVDWSLLGPGAIVGAGGVLVLLGLIGLTRRGD
jgi:hypothetical protein